MYRSLSIWQEVSFQSLITETSEPRSLMFQFLEIRVIHIHTHCPNTLKSTIK